MPTPSHSQLAPAEEQRRQIVLTATESGAGVPRGDHPDTTTIAALRNNDGNVHPQPSSDTVLRAGDVLVAMGTVEALRKLEAMFVPGAARATGSVLGDLG